VAFWQHTVVCASMSDSQRNVTVKRLHILLRERSASTASYETKSLQNTGHSHCRFVIVSINNGLTGCVGSKNRHGWCCDCCLKQLRKTIIPTPQDDWISMLRFFLTFLRIKGGSGFQISSRLRFYTTSRKFGGTQVINFISSDRTIALSCISGIIQAVQVWQLAIELLIIQPYLQRGHH